MMNRLRKLFGMTKSKSTVFPDKALNKKKRCAPAKQSAHSHHGRCAPAHRRTLAPTKAELRTSKDSASANPERKTAKQSAHSHHGRCAPAHRRTLAPTKAELRTRKDSASANSERKTAKQSAHSHHGRCAQRTGARLLQQKPNSERAKACKRSLKRFASA